MIAALAGRRIDALGSPSPRFPATQIGVVESRVRERLGADGVRVLVCAAASGADLLALSAAAERGLRRRLVLPFAVELFRTRSVVDRAGPYPWGELYDRFGELDEAIKAADIGPLTDSAFRRAWDANVDPQWKKAGAPKKKIP